MSRADFQVLLGGAFGGLGGTGAGQCLKSAVEGGGFLIWIALTVVGVLGVVITERYARHDARRRRRASRAVSPSAPSPSPAATPPR